MDMVGRSMFLKARRPECEVGGPRFAICRRRSARKPSLALRLSKRDKRPRKLRRPRGSARVGDLRPCVGRRRIVTQMCWSVIRGSPGAKKETIGMLCEKVKARVYGCE